MATYTYTGRLTDIGAAPLASVLRVRLRVRPEEEAFGPNGIVSATPVDVPVDPATGAFQMVLHPSGELKSKSGRTGVRYILSADRFEETPQGGEWSPGWDIWKFTAVVGGGNIGDMEGASLLAVWIGPPWPQPPLPSGLYIDKAPPNAWGVKE